MKRLCAFFLAAFFIVSGAAAQAETLTVWTVSQIYAQAYEALAESWNREKQRKPACFARSGKRRG